MTYLAEHQSAYMGREITNIRNVNVGDVVEFFYNGMSRTMLVFNPDYGFKMHALDMSKVSRYAIIQMLKRLPTMSPHEFYKKYYRRDSALVLSDAYRTLDVPKIKGLTYISYDVYSVKGSLVKNVIWRRPRINIYKHMIRNFEISMHMSEGSLKELFEKSHNMHTMSDQMWAHLSNSKSYYVKSGDFSFAMRTAIERGWDARAAEDKLGVFKRGGYMEAPMILRNKDHYQVVTGELTLLFCRALRITPVVLIANLEGEIAV